MLEVCLFHLGICLEQRAFYFVAIAGQVFFPRVKCLIRREMILDDVITEIIEVVEIRHEIEEDSLTDFHDSVQTLLVCCVIVIVSQV